METVKLNAMIAISIWGWTKDNGLMIFSDWDPTSTSIGNCSGVQFDSLWDAINCTSKNPFVCQISAEISYCSDGWTYFNATNSCYKKFVDTNGVSFSNAENSCNQENGHLASIHSFEENKFIGELTSIAYTAYVAASVVWLGGQRDGNAENWYWTDNTPFDYYNWGNSYDYTNLDYLLYFPDWTSTYSNSPLQWNPSVICCVYHYLCKKSPILIPIN